MRRFEHDDYIYGGTYMKELEGLAGIVTGGSSGIGLTISNVLAEKGATVYVISRTGTVKEGWPNSIPGVEHIKGNLSDLPAIKQICNELAAKNGGRLDFLINNAGISYKCRAEQFPEAQFDAILETNVKSVFMISQICYPYLKRSPHKGRIVNISSMSAHLGFNQVVPYCASKGAVCAMTRGLAVEWAEDNITVNSISPGWFRTKMTEQVVDKEREALILKRMPMHAFGDIKDLGAMAAHLIGPSASYISGQDFAVDGGALAFGY